MKRWFVGLLVLAALVLIVSPGIVGYLAEKQMQENARWADEENAEIGITTESFDRGWFSSVGRHRLVLENAELQGALGVASDRQMPSIIIDTRVDHGIVPFTSLSGSDGSLRPGLARTISTLHFDAGDGELVLIPGNIVSDIGLTGETSGRYLLEAGSYENAGVSIEWSGADIEFDLSPSAASLSVDGRIQPFSLHSETESAEFGSITFSGEQVASPYGFNTGSVNFLVNEIAVRDRQGTLKGLGNFSMDAVVELENERVNARSLVELGALTLPDVGSVDIEMDIVANKLDAASLGRITRALEEARASAGPGQGMDDFFPVIEADLQHLLTAGMELRFDRFNVSLPQGDIVSNIRLALPESDADSQFSWAGMLLVLEAAANISVSAALVDMAQTMNPQAGGLVQAGFLKQKGENYEMAAEFKSGLLTVNGVPMPIPMPGM